MEIKKVLVVDDEMLVREVTSASLKKMGFEVDKAKNGTEGLKKIKENKPDLVFLDYMMPDLTGLEVAQEIKKDPELAKITIVMISGKAESNDVKKAEEFGIEYYLEKPASPNKIMDFVTDEFFDK